MLLFDFSLKKALIDYNKTTITFLKIRMRWAFNINHNQLLQSASMVKIFFNSNKKKNYSFAKKPNGMNPECFLK